MSERTLNITFLATRSREGQSLLDRFKVEQRHNISSPEATPYQTLRSLFAKDDLVIIDATREANSSEHNYHMITRGCSAQPHVVIVSRNYLPLNITSQNDTIADPATNIVYENAPRYRGTLSNDSLLRFLKHHVEAATHLPVRKTNSASTMLQGVASKIVGGYKITPQDIQRHQKGQIFISFRRDDSKRVEALKQRIEAKENNGFFHGGRSVRYFAPDVVSDEMFTEWRRWNVLSWLDRFIGPADEFWIFKSTTENGRYYFNSWWTLGEILTLAHRRYSGYSGKKMWRVRLYDEATDSLHDLDDAFFPKLSEEHHRRIARWYANTDAAQMGVECLTQAAKMAQSPFLPSPLRSYINDHVFSPEFWTDYILDCSRCRCIGQNQNHFDPNDILWHKGPNFTRFSYTDLQAVRQNDSVVRCGNCKYTFRVCEGTPHYLQLVPNIKPEDARALRDFFHDASGDRYLLSIPSYKLTDA